jgi:hypothetical protein
MSTPVTSRPRPGDDPSPDPSIEICWWSPPGPRSGSCGYRTLASDFDEGRCLPGTEDGRWIIDDVSVSNAESRSHVTR